MTDPHLVPKGELDYELLDREFDRTKSKVFMGQNAAFLGPLMCSINFAWAEDIPSACTNGITMQWNPRFYLKLDPIGRVTVLVHELWHIALLHMLRRGTRNPLIWNYACDICINNMMENDGYSFQNLRDIGWAPWLDHSYGTKSAEEIFEELDKKNQQEIDDLLKQLMDAFPDLIEDQNVDGSTHEHTIINNVVAASQAAGGGGMGLPGNTPGSVTTILKRFLQPKLPWHQLLLAWFTEKSNQDYSWSRPNRRYLDMYLPSLQEDDEGGLRHIINYMDVSGSVSDMDVIRFNSEMKFIKETFNPEKMSLVQFDTRISKEQDFLENDRFDEIVVVGRGGTSLVCVREHIIEHKPSAVVIFSDLQCGVMEKLPDNLKHIPILWIAINNHSATVNQGKLIHLRE